MALRFNLGYGPMGIELLDVATASMGDLYLALRIFGIAVTIKPGPAPAFDIDDLHRRNARSAAALAQRSQTYATNLRYRRAVGNAQ